MRKRIICLLILTVMLVCLTACSSGTNTPDTTDTQDTQDTQDTDPTAPAHTEEPGGFTEVTELTLNRDPYFDEEGRLVLYFDEEAAFGANAVAYVGYLYGYSANSLAGHVVPGVYDDMLQENGYVGAAIKTDEPLDLEPGEYEFSVTIENRFIATFTMTID